MCFSVPMMFDLIPFDHFTPQHTAFEQSAACLSVFLELLPGLILFINCCDTLDEL